MPKRGNGPAPRSWLADAEARDRDPNGWRDSPFGRETLLPGRWKTPTSDKERLDIAAAQAHHRASQALRTFITRSGKTHEQVATAIGMDVKGLYAVLNGSRHISFTDLARIAAVCGREVSIGTRRVSLHKRST